MGKAYDPKITFSSLTISASFTVVRKHEGTLGETIVVVAAPDLDSIGPSVLGSQERTGVYKIELKIPLDVDAPADPRRIIVQQPLRDGRMISVEEPYTEERYKALTEGRPSAAPLVRPGDPLSPILRPRAL